MKCTAVVLIALISGAELPAQTPITGHVTTRVGTAIAGVRVSLRDTANSHRFDVVTDSVGAFEITMPKQLVPGVFIVSTERIGYEAIEEELLHVDDPRGLELVLQLDAKPVSLAPIKVVARKPVKGDVDHFRERAARVKQGGGGHIVDRKTLEAGGTQSVARVLGTVPGLSYLPPRRAGSMETVQSTRGNCQLRFYLDGVPLVVADISAIESASLEGVEVYAGPGEGPAEYFDRRGCGTVLMWSRRGEIVQGSHFPAIGLGVIGVVE